MYVRVYVCVRTWGRSAAKTLCHRRPLFTQRGFFLLREFLLLLVLSTAGFRFARTTFPLAISAHCDLPLLLEPHGRIAPNRRV